MAPADDDHLEQAVDHDEVPTQASHPAVREGGRRGLPRLKELGPYRLDRTLGWGGMGIVYAAEDTRSGEQVALKLLRFSDPEGVSLRRFQQEAEATRRGVVLARWDPGRGRCPGRTRRAHPPGRGQRHRRPLPAAGHAVDLAAPGWQPGHRRVWLARSDDDKPLLLDEEGVSIAGSWSVQPVLVAWDD